MEDMFMSLNEFMKVNEALPSNITKWLKSTAGPEQAKSARKVAGWAKKVGSGIPGGTF